MESSFFFTGLFAAFITGLASSLHCLGMCGGAISAMMLTAKPKSSRAHVATFPIALLISARQVATSPAVAMTNLPLVLVLTVVVF
jgi:sulfite exporter TauE/SafE